MQTNILQSKKILFCGSSELSIGVLDYLKSQNIFPHTIITQPARPVGRKKVLTETIVSDWATKVNTDEGKTVEILKPEKIDSEFLNLIRQKKIDLCLVASYGKILKQELLNIFPEGVWNVHPSALPLYRGATPLPAQIIDGLKEIDVTVIKMDVGMDSGDILSSGRMDFDWEKKSIEKLEYEAGYLGGEIFYKNFNSPQNMNLQRQDHAKATFTKILKKEDGDVKKEIQDKNLEMTWRKYNAYKNWPGIYFYKTPPNPLFKKEEELSPIRIKITQISKDKNTGEIKIQKLLPESKKEITLQDFENSYGKVF